MGDWSPPEPARSSDDDVCFQDLGLSPLILKAVLEDLGFAHCTEIQGLALPHTLEGKDLAGQAQTGTGKTAAFLITILQHLIDRNPPRAPEQPFALVLAPTRELAVQIDKDAKDLGAHCGVRSLAVYGGMDYGKQRDDLRRGVDIVAATPGRLIDYLRQKAIDLSRVQVLVIDEADRMLDMGFIPDIKRIASRLRAPHTRQTLLFSATLSPEILDLAARWMRPDPVRVKADPGNMVATDIDEIIYAVSSREKPALLMNFLGHRDRWRRVLIFRNRRSDVEDLYRQLHRYGFPCEMMSGDVPQKKRMRILEDFRAGRVPVIVATDVAGRGIHVEGISHVINYEMPYDAEDYVHRIGRTGRAGTKGTAISFAGDDCAFVIPEIEAFIGRELTISQPPGDMLEMPKAPAAGSVTVPPRRPRQPSSGHRPHPRRSDGGRPGGGGRSRGPRRRS